MQLAGRRLMAIHPFSIDPNVLNSTGSAHAIRRPCQSVVPKMPVPAKGGDWNRRV